MPLVPIFLAGGAATIELAILTGPTEQILFKRNRITSPFEFRDPADNPWIAWHISGPEPKC
jgi:hypothetical protein